MSKSKGNLIRSCSTMFPSVRHVSSFYGDQITQLYLHISNLFPVQSTTVFVLLSLFPCLLSSTAALSWSTESISHSFLFLNCSLASVYRAPHTLPTSSATTVRIDCISITLAFSYFFQSIKIVLDLGPLPKLLLLCGMLTSLLFSNLLSKFLLSLAEWV